ncbi:helix-turn-helix domain-containing protein [Paludibacter jiangxiensis]|nr:helix-turn-helix domain-containing protein [Paludibacter jiangxiensis]
METTKRKSKKKAVIQRNTYTADQRAKARRYYLMGLNLQEISILLDNAPVRTIEKWQIKEQWAALREIEPIKARALSLQAAGKSYTEIAETLSINRTTVWRYLKQAKSTDKM